MKTSFSIPFFVLFLLTCFSTSLIAQGDEEVIIYVKDTGGSGSNNNDFTEMHTYGKSWNTAFRYLHDALRFGDPNATQIWIAKGNYYVDRGVGVEDQTTDTPEGSLFLNPFMVTNRNIKIYGGFAGNENALSERTPETIAANPTYLDGNVHFKERYAIPDYETIYSSFENSLYDDDYDFAKRIMVVYNSTLTLDGLIFQYVKARILSASGSAEDTERNAGQGAFILANKSALTINNCLFQYGLSGVYGQLIYAENNSAPIRISNSRFTKSGNVVDIIRSYEGDNNKVIVENTVIDSLYRGERLFSNLVKNIELRNSLLHKNDRLQIFQVGLYGGEHTLSFAMENVLAFDNTLGSSDFIVALRSLASDTVNLSIINSSFINNIGDGAIISTHERTGSNKLNLSMHNNVFYGNKTSEDGSTYSEILKTGSNQQFQSTSISHNAADKGDSKLLTESSYNTGKVDLSSVSSLTDLFAGTNDNDGNFIAIGTDEKWFTIDDGFVPKEDGVLHNAGHNDAVTDINSDIKGNLRLQQTTVDIGAYERGTETLGVEGLSSGSEMVLYPNPIRSSEEGNRLLGYVTDTSIKPKQLVLRDLSGKLVRNLAIKDSGEGIDLGVLPTGTYLAILTSENKDYKSFKLVVE